MLPLDMFGPANLDVIAADHLFDLPRRTGAVVDQNYLPFPQLPHRRLTSEDLRRGRTCGVRPDKSEKKDEEYLTLVHHTNLRSPRI